MSGEHAWLRHPESGGHFNCPVAAVEDWLDMGWQKSDPPEETNPVIAEHLAWREREAAKAAEQTKATKSARRGDTAGEMSNG